MELLDFNAVYGAGENEAVDMTVSAPAEVKNIGNVKEQIDGMVQDGRLSEECESGIGSVIEAF